MLRSPVSQLDDSRLAARVRAGNETAFEVLYDRHHRSLLSFCRHMLGSAEDGEDALQQTMVRAHRALVGGGPLPDAVRPWLFAIARNRCKTMLAARREAYVPVEDCEVAFDGLADDVRRRADLRELVGDLARLPEDQRGALVLFELGGLSQAEIAVAIGVPAGKVKALVYQARSELMAERDARATPCTSVREELAVARGGALRRGPLKRHLRQCEGCRAYHTAVASQRAGLASILPVTPALGLKASVLAAAVGGGGSAAGGMGAGAAGAGVAAKGGVAALGAATATATGGGTVAALVAKVAVTAAVVGGGAIGGAAAVDHAAQPAGVPVAATVTASPTPSPVRTVVARERTVDRPPPAPKAKATATPVATTAAATVAATATPTTRATRAPKARKASVRLRRALHRRRARLSAGRSDAGGGSELVVEVGPTRTVRPPQPRPTKPVVRKPKHKRPVVSEGSSPAQTGTSPAATPTPPPVTPVPRPRRPHRAPTPAPTPPPVVATPEPTPEATPTPEPPPAETPAPTPTPTPTP